MLVIGLIKEHIFSIVFDYCTKYSICTNSMLGAQLETF